MSDETTMGQKAAEFEAWATYQWPPYQLHKRPMDQRRGIFNIYSNQRTQHAYEGYLGAVLARPAIPAPVPTIDFGALRKVAHELRTYSPPGDRYNGVYIHPGWADKIEAAIGITTALADDELPLTRSVYGSKEALDAEIARRAALAEPVQAVAVPAGYKLVPIEPTVAMRQAAYDEYHRSSATYGSLAKAIIAAAPAEAVSVREAAIESCSKEEVAAFEDFAVRQKYDMTTHPLHWLFLDPKTYAARQGWKAALDFVRALQGKPEAQAGK